MINCLLASSVLLLSQPAARGETVQYSDVQHALPDGTPDRRAPSNRWVEVQVHERLAGAFTNGLSEPSPTSWRTYGKDEVFCYGSGVLPAGAPPFTLPEPGTQPLKSQLKTHLYVSREPLPARTTRSVYRVVMERTEVESRRVGEREALRWRLTLRTVGFKEVLTPVRKA